MTNGMGNWKRPRWRRAPALAIILLLALCATAGTDSAPAGAQGTPSAANVRAADGPNPGEVIVTWGAVPEATHYRIGYVNMVTDYPPAKASVTGDWINAFIYVDENARNIQVSNGRAEYTVRRLEQGARHAFTVLTSNNFVDTGAAGNVSSTFSWPSNTRWAFHTVADRGGAPVPAPVIDYVTLYPNCEAVRAHYPGGATRSSPIYRSALDSDGDGIACEPAPTPPTPVTPLDPISNFVTSTSTSASATVELKLTVKLKNDVPVGGAFVLYLEDDFQEPDSISASDVYFVSTPSRVTTGSGSLVYATVNPEIDSDDHFTADKDDIDIRVSVPDMCTTDTTICQGANGLRAGDTVTMVIQKSAGIKNPSEAGTHSTGYAILGPTDNVPSGPNGTGFIKANELSTVAKIGLSDVDNSRGYEMTVTGSGFNNGTTAAIYVLHDPTATPDCQRIISEGTLVGHSVVGSDDRVAVTFEVTVPPFGPGNTNYICMIDGEGRMSDTDVEDFYLQPSIRVAPSVASVGDVVTVFAQDFSNPGAAFVRATLAGRPVSGATGTSVRADGSATATITVPTGVIGIVRLDAEWGGIREDTKLHVIP